MQLEFEVENQTIKRIDTHSIVNQSDNYLELIFDFKTEDWENTTKFIYLITDDGKYKFNLENDSYIVPNAFLIGTILTFGVYGVNEDYRVTTNMVKIHMVRSECFDFVEYDPEQFSIDVVEDIYLRIDGKVDKVSGKGLSTNDFDNAYKNQLDTLYDTIITAIKEEDYVTFTDLLNYYTKLQIDNLLNTKVDNSDVSQVGFTGNYNDLLGKPVIPSRVSQLDNDSGFINDLSNYYSKSQIDELIDSLNNRLILNGDENIIQKDDVLSLVAYIVEEGMPLEGKKIYFYEVEEE